MLTELFFTAGNEKVPYYIMKEYKQIGSLFSDASYDCYYIVCDKNVEISELLGVAFYKTTYQIVTMSILESDKTFSELNKIIELLINKGVTRNSCLVAVGGGVIGNMIGLVASLIYRGISFIHIPTSIMAASDSVLSLKQAVNSQGVKNIIGSYYAPKFICTIYSLFKTLSQRDFYAGLVESAKNILINANQHEEFLKNYDYENYNNYYQFHNVIVLSLEIKNSLLAYDKFEKKQAIALEYGHTFGHAIEMITRGIINHGESVAFGMIAAARVSRNMNLINDDDVAKHIELLNYIFPQLKEIPKLDPKIIIKEMEKDNKRGYIAHKDGALPLVLLSKNIKSKPYDKCTIINVDKQIIEKSIFETYEIINNFLLVKQ